jgi:hypothetical protein
MVAVGLLVTLAGFLITVSSLGLASSVGARLVIVLVGIAVSLFGIIGFINPAYLKNAIWKGDHS